MENDKSIESADLACLKISSKNTNTNILCFL